MAYRRYHEPDGSMLSICMDIWWLMVISGFAISSVLACFENFFYIIADIVVLPLALLGFYGIFIDLSANIKVRKEKKKQP